MKAHLADGNDDLEYLPTCSWHLSFTLHQRGKFPSHILPYSAFGFEAIYQRTIVKVFTSNNNTLFYFFLSIGMHMAV